MYVAFPSPWGIIKSSPHGHTCLLVLRQTGSGKNRWITVRVELEFHHWQYPLGIAAYLPVPDAVYVVLVGTHGVVSSFFLAIGSEQVTVQIAV